MTKHIPNMINNAREILQNAYAPYSKFKVACCLQSNDDQLYVGVNVENASYGLTICAETAAICQLVANGKRTIQSLVLMNGEGSLCPPCGACRQRIFEFSTPDTKVYLCDHEKVLKIMSMDELLPLAFKFQPPSGNNHD